MSFQRQFRWLHGFLLASFMLLCGAVGLVRAASGNLDNSYLKAIRPTQSLMVSITGFLGWLGSSVLAVAIALVILPGKSDR